MNEAGVFAVISGIILFKIRVDLRHWALTYSFELNYLKVAMKVTRCVA